MEKRMDYLLKKYNGDKARIAFLKMQLERMTPECHEDYIEYRMYRSDHVGKVPVFIVENNVEVAALNNVERTALDYRERCRTQYLDAKAEIEDELQELVYNVSLLEDCLEIMEQYNRRYKQIIEKFYIHSLRMEDIADSMNISRSRCYDMCKEAVRWMARLVYGDNSVGG